MKLFNIALSIFLLTLCLHLARGQNVTGSHAIYEGVGYADLAKSDQISAVTVDSDDVKLSYPSAVLSGGGKWMTVMYLRIGRDPRIILKRSADGGYHWSEREYPAIGNDEATRVATLLETFNGKRGAHQLNIIKGAGIFQQSVSPDNGVTWSAFEPVNGFGGFRITDVIKTRTGGYIALFSDDGRFIHSGDSISMDKPVIYQISSVDGGMTWSLPQVMLKHNIYGLTEATVARQSRKGKNTLVLIASEPVSKAAMVSFSNDEGASWSYPVELPGVLHGDRHRIFIKKNKVYIVFRDTKGFGNPKTVNSTYGDLMMWIGDVADLKKGTKGEMLVRLADNYPSAEFDITDINTIDCGYAAILPSGKNNIAVIAYGQWDRGKPAYIKCFIMDPESIYRKGRRAAG